MHSNADVEAGSMYTHNDSHRWQQRTHESKRTYYSLRVSRTATALRAGIAAAAITAPLTFANAPAFATEPLTLDSNFTDIAGVVADDEAMEAKLAEVDGGDLWIVIVPDFDGIDAQVWAEQTLSKSGLQRYDGIVAIGTDSRDVGYFTNSPNGLTKEVLDQAINDDVLDLLGEQRWEDGTRLIVDNVVTLLDGGSLSNAGRNGALALGGVALVGGGGAWLYSRSKKKKTAQRQAQNLEAKAKDASRALLDADDDVRTAAAELEFARAEFGLQATQEFENTLNTARQALKQAFALRTLLDDDDPETPEQQLEMNSQILQLVGEARAQLDAQQRGFSELRNLAANLDAKRDGLEQRAGEIERQLPLAHSKLQNLSLSYSTASFASLTEYPAQIAALLDSGRDSLAKVNELMEQGKRNEAVPYAKLAESSINQAADLLSQIDQAPELLDRAQEELQARIASLSSDVRDAQRLGQGQAHIEAASATAQSILATAHKDAAHTDVFALVRELTSAETNLDNALSSVRAEEENRIRLQGNSERMRSQAESAIADADAYVSRYRARISADARTYLARAHNALAQGDQLELSEAQIQHYEQAASLASTAKRAAERSIDDDYYTGYPGGRNRSGNGDFLAGVIVSSILNGALGGGHSGGFSGGSFGAGGGGFGGGFSSGGGGRKAF
ncbi:MAG: hypothetical protein PUK40_02860 [Actinomycetaceae bacterium]|nr:hypothetical protein [Arcanobacterium sp.]MDD7504881.1 hypothetical protein [Actinomycetaceae bacterium]